jgi:2-dehydro-3-deoxyphosphogluconate aldolase/(4S)-4-hydroxy-2-oxoglutarate aldolase
MSDAAALRTSLVANAIRAHRLVVVLRRVEPRDALLALVGELHDSGARIFEITMDGPTAADDLRAVRVQLGSDTLVGAGTVLTAEQLDAAGDAGAAFAVSPVFDAGLVGRAVSSGRPFIAGAMTPTEIRAAWEAGATFVKLFPASAVGPSFVRELRGPMSDVQLVPTGGVDGANARAFLDAGAVAVGIGGAIVRADSVARRRLITDLVGGRTVG